MPRDIPPLNPLRTFEAGARHLNFTEAAQELNVTPGAVSRQIRVLEEFLGVALFERGQRENKLTEKGLVYFNSLSEVFSRIEAATKSITDIDGQGPLRIWCSMTVAMRWLMPRLPVFHTAHPLRDVLFTTSLRPIDFGTNGVDVAIRSGQPDLPGIVSHRLFDTDLVPVCSPSLLHLGRPLRSYDDLTHQTLLHSVLRPNEWASWLKAVGATSVNASRGIKFDSSSLAYQAATEGLGIAMARLALIKDDLEAGRLVRPFDFVLSSGVACYLIYPEHATRVKHLLAFRDWILTEANNDEKARRTVFPPARPVSNRSPKFSASQGLRRIP